MSNSDLCYSTIQLVHITGQLSALKAEVDVSYTNDGDLNVTVSEIEAKGVSVFVQVCCKDFGCFSVGNLQETLSPVHVGHAFLLHDEVTVTIISCPLLPKIEFGSISCSGNGYKDVCTIRCDYGFAIRDRIFSLDRTCGADGIWDGNEPTCSVVDCGDFPAVSHTQ